MMAMGNVRIEFVAHCLRHVQFIDVSRYQPSTKLEKAEQMIKIANLVV